MKHTHKLLNLLIAFLVIAYVIYFFFDKNQLIKLKAHLTSQSESNEIDHVVNKHLQQTTAQIVKDQIATAKALKKATEEPIKVVTPDISSQIPLEQQIHKANETALQSNSAMSYKLNFENHIKKNEIVNKEEYARQFIENARKGGYHIELGDDLEVKSVTPIRKPSQEIDTGEIFQSN